MKKHKQLEHLGIMYVALRPENIEHDEVGVFFGRVADAQDSRELDRVAVYVVNRAYPNMLFLKTIYRRRVGELTLRNVSLNEECNVYVSFLILSIFLIGRFLMFDHQQIDIFHYLDDLKEI